MLMAIREPGAGSQAWGGSYQTRAGEYFGVGYKIGLRWPPFTEPLRRDRVAGRLLNPAREFAGGRVRKWKMWRPLLGFHGLHRPC